MKISSFEINNQYFEFYNLRQCKKEALIKAKELNEPILITCVYKPSYKMDWFTLYPDGRFETNALKISANN